ncbi:MAG TPA: hypothetical protein VMH86_16050 [Rhizomicrobium sp.]|nr:hypothetical protein [Rhizomicrobium sp.]
MTITMGDEPAGIRRIAHTALAKRLHLNLRSLRGAPKTGAPIPLYRATPDSILHKTSRPRRTGWRVPVVGGEIEGLVNIHTAGGSARYAGINEGVLSGRLMAAAAIAQAKLGKSRERFELRLLELPDLRFHALWLHTRNGRDHFVPLSHEHLFEMRLLGEGLLRALIRRASGRPKPRKRRAAIKTRSTPRTRVPSAT